MDRSKKRAASGAYLPWDQAIQQSTIGFFACSSPGRILLINEAARNLSGLSSGDWVWSAIAPTDRRNLHRNVVENLGNGRFLNDEIMVVNVADRREVRVQLQLFPGAEPGGVIVGTLADVAQRSHEEEKLRFNARHDSLTGLLNRDAVITELQHRLDGGASRARTIVLFVDLNRFKQVNDAYGHEAGDHLLRVIGKRLEHGVRTGDVVGRLGGDEFVILSSVSVSDGGSFIKPDDQAAEETDAPTQDALQFARRLRAAVTQPVAYGDLTLQPEVSIGVTVQASDQSDAKRLIADADGAMYEAKTGSLVDGGSITVSGPKSRDRLTRRLAIAEDLENGWRTAQISFAFQPIRDLRTSEVLGAEAFARWNHPRFGSISPLDFLATLNTAEQLASFTKWSLDQICGQWADLRRRYPRFVDKAVSINIFPRQLTMPDFVAVHLDTLERHGLRVVDVLLEVQDWERRSEPAVEESLRSLGNTGIPIVLDYFGVGYNAMEYLGRLPVVGFKVAPALTASLADSETTRAVVRGLLLTGAELGIATLSEGIEHPQQAIWSLDLGITWGQGYALGSPLPIAEFEAQERYIEEAGLRLPYDRLPGGSETD